MTDASAISPYAAPASNLSELPNAAQAPSISEALTRGYDFRIGELLSESWTRTKGTKGIIIGGFLVFYAALFAAINILTMVLAFVGVAGLAGIGLLSGGEGDGLAMGAIIAFVVGTVVITVLAMALVYPFLAGINMIGIRRAADQPLKFTEIFSHFGRSLPVILTALLMTLLTYIGFLLFIIPGIYLSVAYMLAIPLVVERGLSPWQALEASRKAIGQHWFKVFGLLFLLGLITILAAIPLGIGLIWSIPLMVVTIGVLYRTIFGVLPVAK